MKTLVPRTAILLLLTAAVSGRSSVAADKKADAKAADSPRKYAEGPLAPADFRAAVPDPAPVKDGVRLRAMTHTEILYSTRWLWEEAKPGNVTAWLSEFEIHSQLLRDKCWISEPSDLRLIDHEQGHFDISEIHTRRAQKKFTQLMASKGLVGHGRDETTAVADLNKQVRDLMQQVFDKERDEQIEYDKVTNHGREHASQAKLRGQQREQLKESERKGADAKGK